MPEQSKSIPIELARYTEALRRRLYDLVTQHLWEPTGPGDYVPPYSPDDCGLMVVFLHGRWLVLYLDLEEPTDAPPDRRMVMSRIIASSSTPTGIQLSEV